MWIKKFFMWVVGTSFCTICDKITPGRGPYTVCKACQVEVDSTPYSNAAHDRVYKGMNDMPDEELKALWNDEVAKVAGMTVGPMARTDLCPKCSTFNKPDYPEIGPFICPTCDWVY